MDDLHLKGMLSLVSKIDLLHLSDNTDATRFCHVPPEAYVFLSRLP